MSGAFYCRSELSAPWGLTLPPMPGYMWFHAPISGEVLLESRETEKGVVRRGDFALVPHGEGHTLRSEPARAHRGSSNSSVSRSATGTRSFAMAAAEPR